MMKAAEACASFILDNVVLEYDRLILKLSMRAIVGEHYTDSDEA